MSSATTNTNAAINPTGASTPVPRKAFPRANESEFKVVASLRDPSEAHSANHVDEEQAFTRTKAAILAVAYQAQGYWVEVFGDEGELLAGPLDPDQRIPSYIV